MVMAIYRIHLLFVFQIYRRRRKEWTEILISLKYSSYNQHFGMSKQLLYGLESCTKSFDYVFKRLFKQDLQVPYKLTKAKIEYTKDTEYRDR